MWGESLLKCSEILKDLEQLIDEEHPKSKIVHKKKPKQEHVPT